MGLLPTYRWGYGPDRKTIRDIRQQATFSLLDPEFQRRLIRLLRAARRAGVDVGIGGAARTSAQQEALFLSRHSAVPSGGCCSYNGKRYTLKPGNAHAAPPGLSYHEPLPYGIGALAVDVVGWENGWVTANMGQFGLRDIPGERWHLQPVEIAGSRREYNGPYPLPRWRFKTGLL